MKTTLIELIQTALAKRIAGDEQNNEFGIVRPETLEAETLANNALEEKIQELIETKVTQMLKELRP